MEETLKIFVFVETHFYFFDVFLMKNDVFFKMFFFGEIIFDKTTYVFLCVFVVVFMRCFLRFGRFYGTLMVR